eukprot:CAMPEP_0170375660 /NCGR_PEP_ID=MMETSP0117_2-20130122/11276_1 /TAXON_ID=400756 /ORGANISM="Durinskia baltica, Strain CSIRO CS-38" /LENGTH=223 /DNA_ID=CAMNT_0010630743 /DNA_START=102 /DNA_END=773 /DNA_ORIENTATION=-
MRLLGVSGIILGIIQIGLSASAYSLTSWNVGAWWAGSFAVITAMSAVVSNNRCAVVAGCVFACISIALLVVGLILDGIVFATVSDFSTCYDKDTTSFYGSDSAQDEAYAFSCANQHSKRCGCVRDDNDDCYILDLRDGNNCGVIMNKYPSLLLGSVLFMIALIIVTIVYSACTCKNLCCANPRDDNTRLTGASGVSSSTASAAIATPAAAMATPVSAKGADAI